MSLACYDQSQQLIWAEAPMDVAGIEIALDCGASTEIWVTCDLRDAGSDRQIERFTRELTFGPILDLPFEPDLAEWWQYFPGGVAVQRYACQVGYRPPDTGFPFPRPVFPGPIGVYRP